MGLVSGENRNWKPRVFPVFPWFSLEIWGFSVVFHGLSSIKPIQSFNPSLWCFPWGCCHGSQGIKFAVATSPLLHWFVVWNMNFIFPQKFGISSSQLTFIQSFFRGLGLNHQSISGHISHISGHISGHIECFLLPQRGANIEAKDDNECLGPPGRSAPSMLNVDGHGLATPCSSRPGCDKCDTWWSSTELQGDWFGCFFWRFTSCWESKIYIKL